MVFSYMWNWDFSEVVISAPQVGYVKLHAYEIM